jgi:hypothetical protein
MAITASLANFTVPAGTNQGTVLMPKLKYRFRAIFVNFGSGKGDVVELTRQVADIKRPSVNFNPFAIDVYNSKVYLQGKPEWQETSINLRDDASGMVAKLVAEQIQKQYDFMEQSSAATAGDYKFALRYEVLDGGNGSVEPAVLETWDLEGCQISQADWGDMNYGTSEAATIALTVRFDNAVLTPLAPPESIPHKRFGSGTATVV